MISKQRQIHIVILVFITVGVISQLLANSSTVTAQRTTLILVQGRVYGAQTPQGRTVYYMYAGDGGGFTAGTVWVMGYQGWQVSFTVSKDQMVVIGTKMYKVVDMTYTEVTLELIP